METPIDIGAGNRNNMNNINYRNNRNLCYYDKYYSRIPYSVIFGITTIV